MGCNADNMLVLPVLVPANSISFNNSRVQLCEYSGVVGKAICIMPTRAKASGSERVVSNDPLKRWTCGAGS